MRRLPPEPDEPGSDEDKHSPGKVGLVEPVVGPDGDEDVRAVADICPEDGDSKEDQRDPDESSAATRHQDMIPEPGRRAVML